MPLDTIKMFMGDPYVLNEHITIRQPTLREIIDYGERDYLSMVSLLTAYPSDMKSVLWDMGVDYTKVTDFEVFVAFYRFLTPDKTSILFGDLNLSALTPDTNAVGEMCLVGPDGTVIDWNIHRKNAVDLLMETLLDKANQWMDKQISGVNVESVLQAVQDLKELNQEDKLVPKILEFRDRNGGDNETVRGEVSGIPQEES